MQLLRRVGLVPLTDEPGEFGPLDETVPSFGADRL
jgi:hypothetical protein